MPKWTESTGSSSSGGGTIGSPGAPVTVVGTVIYETTTIETTTDLAGTAALYSVDTSAGGVSVTLPALTDGIQFYVKKIDSSSNKVSVIGPIDDMTSVDLVYQYDAVHLIANADSWLII